MNNLFQKNANVIANRNKFYIAKKIQRLILYILMIRNLQISKETQDRVKLAKKFIEDKYQVLLEQELKYQDNWEKLIKQMDKNNLDMQQKHNLAMKIIEQQSIKKRIQRTKDGLSNYKLLNIIGRGAFGEVRLARNLQNNQVVAIKRLEKKKLQTKKQIYNAYLERDFMIKNKSEFLVEFKSTFQDKNYLYLVMQYVPGGDLLHLLIQKDVLSQQQTRFYIAQMIIAVQQIHRNNYIHRDIKPDNILLDSRGHIKISDFGLSKYLQNFEKFSGCQLTKITKLKKNNQMKGRNRAFSKVGTPDYISPQVLISQNYDYSVDIWGVGVIMFESLFGYPPFSHDDSKEVCNRVVNWLQYLQFPDDIKVSTQAKMLILGMMNTRQQRLTIKQIKKHPFFKQINWQNIRKQKAPIIPNIKNEIDTNNFDKFQQQVAWIQQKQKRHRPKASSTQFFRFNYAGYDYKPYEDKNIFEQVRKQIMVMTRDKSKQKSTQKSLEKAKSRKSSKRIKTQQQLQRNKERLSIRDQKMRGSVGFNKQNHTRLKQALSMKKTNKLRVMKRKTQKLL